MVDLAFGKRGAGERRGCIGAPWAIDEEELSLLVEEYVLPLEPQSHWDDLVEESNRYFKRQYKDARERQSEYEEVLTIDTVPREAAATDFSIATSNCWQTMPNPHYLSTGPSSSTCIIVGASSPTMQPSASGPRRPPAKLFDLSAAVVAAHFSPELRDCLPDDVLTAVQQHMTKKRQIECLHEYKRWAPASEVVVDNNTNVGGAVPKVGQLQLVKHCPYDGLGRKHGLATEWRSNGRLWRTTRFEFGLRTGEHAEYFASNGRKALEVQYRDERVHGLVRWWYESGRLAGQQTFVDGRKHGPGHAWREDGSLWRAKHYRDDVKHGLCRTFDPQGRVAKCVRYEAGRKRGRAGAAQLTTSGPSSTSPAGWGGGLASGFTIV